MEPPARKQLELCSVLAAVFALPALFAAYVYGLAALALGIVGISRIRADKKFNGIGLAIFGVVVGAWKVIAWFLALNSP